MITALIISVYIIGYTTIVFEHSLELNKAALALITGALYRTIYILQSESVPALVFSFNYKCYSIFVRSIQLFKNGI